MASLFLAGAAYSWHIRDQGGESAEMSSQRSAWRTALTSTGVIFVAEWGDLTQIITANLAARYHSAASVALGAVSALWAVAAIAVIGGSGLLRVLSVRMLRITTAVVLAGLGAFTLAGAL